jgi:hypothetical protein
LWSFDSTASNPYFFEADKNPATLKHYYQWLEGTINLQVTDTSINGGVTNFSFALVPYQFPEYFNYVNDEVDDSPPVYTELDISTCIDVGNNNCDGGSGGGGGGAVKVKFPSDNPSMRSVELKFTHPAMVDSEDSYKAIEYSWSLDTPDMPAGLGYTPQPTDSLFSNASGSADLTTGAASHESTMTLPFILEQQTVNLRLTIKGYSDSSFTTLIGINEIVHPLNLDPGWEYLVNDDDYNRCVNASAIASGTIAVLSPCGEASTLWSFNPINRLIYSKTAVLAGDYSLCLNIAGSARLSECDVNEPDQRYYFGPWTQ